MTMFPKKIKLLKINKKIVKYWFSEIQKEKYFYLITTIQKIT